MKIIKAAFYILVIFFFALLSVEIILRISGFPYSSPHIMYDKSCYWRMAPNQKMHFKDPYGNSATVTINSLGTRGQEVLEPKSSSRKQVILCLGDSFTYGLGVDDKQTYPFYLQSLINRDSLNIKVFNFGCNGHTILHEVDFLKKYGLSSHPDYVILETSLQTDFCDINELDYNIGYMPFFGYNFIKTCIRKTSIGNIMLSYWNSKKAKDILSHRKQVSSEADQENIARKGSSVKMAKLKNKDAFDIYIDKLNELVYLGQKNNFHIIYVIMPWGAKSLDEAKICCVYTDSNSSTARDFYEFLKKEYSARMKIIELMSPLRSKDIFLPDGHLNARGNQLVAKIIYEEVQRMAKPN